MARRSGISRLYLISEGRPPPDPSWSPGADVYRGAGVWLVKLDLAGVRPQDVSVNLRGRRLTVQGVRRDATCAEGFSHYQMEIAYSSFERRLDLPFDPDPDAVDMAYRDGMLMLRLREKG